MQPAAQAAGENDDVSQPLELHRYFGARPLVLDQIEDLEERHVHGQDHDTDDGKMGRTETRLRKKAGLREGLIERSR